MHIGVLGTGRVARTIAAAWSRSGHQLSLGSRDPASKSPGVPVRSLAEVVATADVIVNATPGAASLLTLSAVGADAFAGKVLIDVANANTPAFELVYPNSSLGEQLQAALPGARVVKTMNTAAMTVLTDPSSLAPTSVFLSGDDPAAKTTVAGLLHDLGWADDAIVDLGGIATARGVEHYFLLFAALMQTGGPNFNIRVVR
jgi:predicted dinucleotide-binding enzyme